MDNGNTSSAVVLVLDEPDRAPRRGGPPPLPDISKPPPLPVADADAEPPSTPSDAGTHLEPAPVLKGFPWFSSAVAWTLSAMVHLLLALALAVFGLRTADSTPRVTTLMAQLGADEDELLTGMQVDAPPISLSTAIFEAGVVAGPESPHTPAVPTMAGFGVTTIGPPAGGMMGQGGAGGEKVGGRGYGQFFGVRAAGNRFVFVVDCSGSMRHNGWDDCRYELVSAVRRLKETQYFYVLLFNSRSYQMFDSNKPEPRMVPATYKNLARLERWLDGFHPQGSTLPLKAVQFAMGLHPDAIYLLTDGEIQDNTDEWLKENIVREDAYEMGRLRTVVHTIGFVSDSGQEMLERIARDCGGTYKYVKKTLPSRRAAR